MQHDVRGLQVTAASAAAAQRLDETVEGYLGFRRDTGERLKAAFAADPQMPLAHVLRGYFMKLFSVPALERKARESLHAAEAAAAAQGATQRERRHIAALAAWCDGDFETARARWEDILLHDPRDIVALKLATFLHFYLGDAANLRDSAARVLPAWDEATPGYGYVLGVHAFGLEESGDYAAAERTGRRAVELNPADIWAGHAVAHVMEMQGRQRDGIAWIDGLESHWRGLNNFRFHVWWHRALYWLELGDYERVLALYDAEVRKELTDEYLDICNGAALLWRLEDRGVDVGRRWEELAARSAVRVDDHLMVFADMHFVMALAAGGTPEQVERMLASMRQAALSDATEAQVAAEVGLPLAEAIVAYRTGRFARAVELLLPIRYRLLRIGGSHAQRDVFQQILVEAALKAEDFILARALLAERTAQRPFSAAAWANLAAACRGLGDAAGVARAQRQAEAASAA
jgi:tetratricopeptide (TPR) repeat protein